MSGVFQAVEVVFFDEDEDDDKELDNIERAFLESDDGSTLVIHQADCPTNTTNEYDDCDCTPVTLVRGGKA